MGRYPQYQGLLFAVMVKHQCWESSLWRYLNFTFRFIAQLIAAYPQHTGITALYGDHVPSIIPFTPSTHHCTALRRPGDIVAAVATG
jgi:hypothetical protein